MNFHFVETNEDPCGICPEFHRGMLSQWKDTFFSKSKPKSVWTDSQCGDLKILSDTTLDKLALN